MIRVQIVERQRAGKLNLFRTLKHAMRSGDLRTFSLERRGKKVVHQRYPGWMNWSYGEGVITCEILSTRKPEGEWQFLGALVGRLTDKYGHLVESIHIQPASPAVEGSRTKK